VTGIKDRIVRTYEKERDAYAGDADRPVASYTGLAGAFTAGVVGLGLLARRRDALPERIRSADVVLSGIATYRLSRLITKDSVTAFVRAPFTRFEEPTGEGEVSERPRGQGVRHAVGELLTCPFCMSVWVGTGFAFGLMLAPRATRLAAMGLTVVAASDNLQLLNAAARKAATEK